MEKGYLKTCSTLYKCGILTKIPAREFPILKVVLALPPAICLSYHCHVLPSLQPPRLLPLDKQMLAVTLICLSLQISWWWLVL